RARRLLPQNLGARAGRRFRAARCPAPHVGALRSGQIGEPLPVSQDEPELLRPPAPRQVSTGFLTQALAGTAIARPTFSGAGSVSSAASRSARRARTASGIGVTRRTDRSTWRDRNSVVAASQPSVAWNIS